MKKEKNGICSSVNKASWEILAGDEKIVARLGVDYTEKNLPAVGDNLIYFTDEYGIHYITSILPRKNELFRIITRTKRKQMLAVNIDIVFIVTSMNDEFNIGRLERFAIIANLPHARTCFILTKKDLCADPDSFLAKMKERFPDAHILPTNALAAEGVEDLLNWWKAGERAVFIGSSGVGKSTFINALAGSYIAETGEIRESDSKGRHTTTTRNMFKIADNRLVIDTPGIREVGTSSYDEYEGVKAVFEKIAYLERECKYSNCKHISEDGCAIKEALENEEITYEELHRYNLFNTEKKSKKEKEEFKQVGTNRRYRKNVSKKKQR